MNAATLDALRWLGILFCVSQSAMFSGLNLAYFSISRLRLEVEASTGSEPASRILKMREDSNFLLTTILWGNVGINVLLTLLSNSVMAGVSAFLFSTVVITMFGEILPQAYFSRNALKIGARLAPVLTVYQYLLYPVAKPIAIALDAWLGKEGVEYFGERGMREFIRQHMRADEADLGKTEGIGALNFFSIDDALASQEGEPLDPSSILKMQFEDGLPIFPDDSLLKDGSIIRDIQRSQKKWVVITDHEDEPRIALDTDGFLRSALLSPDTFNPHDHCHRPIVIRSDSTRLGYVLRQFEVHAAYPGDNVIDRDVVLLWAKQKRVITGADILGRLLLGISKVK